MSFDNSQPLYSIIVPVYNAEKTLNRCVDSILAQTYKNFELFLVNDGSCDHSAEIIDQYAAQDSRIIAIHKQNGGVSSARNIALDRAKGKFIAFADSDDEMRPQWIETFMEIIGTSDIAVQAIDFKGYETEIMSIGNHKSEDAKILVEKLMEKYILGYLFAKLFKKEIIETHHIRFNETIHLREDDIFVLDYLVYVKSWSSTTQSNYIYYMPTADKKYGTSRTECTEYLFNSLNLIYNGIYSPLVLTKQSWSLKGAIVNNILSGKDISPILLDAYRQTFSPGKNFRQKLSNFLILHSSSLGFFPKLILKLINH